MTYFDAIRRAVREEMARDPSIIVIGEDVGAHGGPYGTTKGLHEEFGENRVIETPIIESGFFDMSLGLSLMGFRPLVDLMVADFITLCTDQVIHGASHYPFMFDVKMPVTLRGPIGGGLRFTAAQEKSIEAMLTNFPGLIIVYPSTPSDAYGLLKSALRCDDPVIVFEHKLMYFYSIRDEIPEAESPDALVPIGQADVKRPGSDLTIISWGWPARESVRAAAELADEIDIEVVDLRTLRPLDRKTIVDSVKKTGRAMIVQEAPRFGGFAGEVAATIGEFAFDYLDRPVLRLGAPEYPIAFSAPIQDDYLITSQKIVEFVRKNFF